MSPFPGMDPYLEHPTLWPGVHNALIAAAQRTLAPQLKPNYLVRLEERTYLAEPEELVFIGKPDVTVVSARPGANEGPANAAPTPTVAVRVPTPDIVRETWLEVRAAASGDVVTVLELLSPTNKRPGSAGRQSYEAKRLTVLGTRTHLVEIDLVRAHPPMTVYGTDRTSDYRILISRGDRRPRAELLLFSVRDAIPAFRLPLRGGDEEPVVDLGDILRQLYEELAYDASIDYRAEPVPPLSAADAQWADEVLHHAGKR